MKLICIQSRVNAFKVGDICKAYHDKFGSLCVDGSTVGGWVLNGGDGMSIFGVDKSNPMATFKRHKSLLKMLVRAHVNYAKSRGWGDSKNGGNKSWKRSGYKSVNDWARCFALSYDLDDIREDAQAEGQPLDQEFVNWFVDEEMSYF